MNNRYSGNNNDDYKYLGVDLLKDMQNPLQFEYYPVYMVSIIVIVISLVLNYTVIRQGWVNLIPIIIGILTIIFILLTSPYGTGLANFFTKLPTAQKVFLYMIVFSLCVFIYLKVINEKIPPRFNYVVTSKGEEIGNPEAGEKNVIGRFKNTLTIPINNLPDLSTNFMTVSCWLKLCPRNFIKGQSEWITIYTKGFESDNPYENKTPGLFIKPGENTLMATVNCENGPSLGNAMEINDVPVNEWFCVTMVFATNSMGAYINGKLVKEMTLTGSIKHNGGDFNVGSYFGGIAYMRIFGTALEPQSVFEQYDLEKGYIHRYQQNQDKCYTQGQIKRLKTNCYFMG